MKNFNRDDRSGGDRGFKKRSFGGGFGGDRNRGFGGRDGGKPFMHKAICAQCGKECQVPFKPTGDRAVFCSDCFERKGNMSQGRPENSNQRRSNFGDKPMFEAVCSKCGNRCEVPFRPVEGKPVFCKQCFDKGATGGGNKGGDQFKSQFEMLNAKLDKILKTLAPASAAEVVQEKKGVKEGKPTSAPKSVGASAGKKGKAKAAAKKAPTKK